MPNYHLSLPGNIHIALDTPCAINKNPETLLQLGAHVPGFSLSDDVLRSPQILVSHSFSQEPVFTQRDNRFDIRTPKQDKLPDDICHLLYGITRKEMLARHLYPVHAACVGNKEGHTLIVGHSGSGKTTLASALIDDGLTLFSGNKTVIKFGAANALHAISGTKTMTALDENRERQAYELSRENYTAVDIVPITEIHIVKLNDGVEETQELSPLSALHTLYPYFLDTVNADIIINGRDIYSGNVSEYAKKNLIDSLTKTLSVLPVRKSSGSLDYLKQKVLT